MRIKCNASAVNFRPIVKDSVPKILVVAVVCLGTLHGCVVGPQYTRPETAVPDAWHQALTEGLVEGEADLRTWWTAFNDPVLDNLIERAGQGNLDVRAAVARVQEARAFRGVTTGERLPDIDGTGTAQRTRVSEGIVPSMPDRTDNFFQLGLDSSWEIDLWGRITRSIESADASLQASIEDYRDVLVVLYAEVALSYVRVRSLQARVALAESNVEAQRQMLQLTKDRHEAGLVSELDVFQAELNVATTESFIPTLQILLARSIHRLGILLGEHPGALYDQLSASAPIPEVPSKIVVELPANLVRQRPDIRRAEREIAAQTARIGVATADLYPRFSLLGTFGFEATDFEDLLEGGSRAYGIGPAFRWNLFDGGRVRNYIKVEEARTEQALARYEQTVLLAMEEVENAMVTYVQETGRMRTLEEAVTASERSVDLVSTLYKSELTDFQNVLDMQRSLFLQQDNLAASKGNVTNNLIRIYKSLGGGWGLQSEQSEPSATE